MLTKNISKQSSSGDAANTITGFGSSTISPTLQNKKKLRSKSRTTTSTGGPNAIAEESGGVVENIRESERDNNEITGRRRASNSLNNRNIGEEVEFDEENEEDEEEEDDDDEYNENDNGINDTDVINWWGLLTGEKSGERVNDGLYLDALVWRIVGQLVSELLLSNSGKLLTILVAAAANNAATGAANAVLSGVKGTLESAYNYNPLSLANRGLGNLKRINRASLDQVLYIIDVFSYSYCSALTIGYCFISIGMLCIYILCI